MSQKNKVVYPVSSKTMHDYAESIFSPIRRGENVTTVWVPMAGRRTHNQFIINNIDLFKKELPFSEKYILVYVEPLDLTEESASGYLRLVGRSFIGVCKGKKEIENLVDLKSSLEVFNDETTTYSELLDTLKALIADIAIKGFDTVLFLGEFDEINYASTVFFGNLKSLWDKVHPSLHYIFLLKGMVAKIDNIKSWGEELSELILQNTIYVPLLEEKDIDYMVKRLSNEYFIKLSEIEEKDIVRLCKGHPYLLKIAVREASVLKETNKKVNLVDWLNAHYEIRSVARRLYDHSSSEEKQILRQIVIGESVDSHDQKESVGYLKKVGLIEKKSDGGYKLFSGLFRSSILSLVSESEGEESKKDQIRLGESGNVIMLGDRDIEEKFTLQERLLMIKFLNNIGKVTTRDEIGNVLWGKEAYEKYSDWAIDQIVSKVRKKIKNLDIDAKVKTVRGRGYKLDLH